MWPSISTRSWSKFTRMSAFLTNLIWACHLTHAWSSPALTLITLMLLTCSEEWTRLCRCVLWTRGARMCRCLVFTKTSVWSAQYTSRKKWIRWRRQTKTSQPKRTWTASGAATAIAVRRPNQLRVLTWRCPRRLTSCPARNCHLRLWKERGIPKKTPSLSPNIIVYLSTPRREARLRQTEEHARPNKKTNE